MSSSLHESFDELHEHVSSLHRHLQIMRCRVNALTVFDRFFEAIDKRFARSKVLRTDKINHAKVLHEVVLKGVSSEHDATFRGNGSEGHGDFRGDVLDLVTLITDDKVWSRVEQGATEH